MAALSSQPRQRTILVGHTLRELAGALVRPGHFDVVIGPFVVVVFMRTLGVPAEARSQ